MLTELITSDEYNAGRGVSPENVPESLKESLDEKVRCITMEKCKKHLNLPDPSLLQHERCWKG